MKLKTAANLAFHSEFLYICIFLFLLGIASSCATPGVPVSIVRPAEIDLARYERVAVGEFTGKNGNLIEQELIQALMSTSRFDVLDRAHLNVVLNEQKLGQSGLVDDRTAANLGNISGTSVIIVGNVNDYHFNENLEKNEWTDSKGGYHVSYTRKGRAHVEVFFKVLDAVTSRVIASKSLEAWDSGSLSDDSPPPHIDPTNLYTNCRRKVIENFMKVIAPYKETVRVPLYAADKVPQTNLGQGAATVGNWNKAREHFSAALEAAHNDPKLAKDKKLLAKLHCNIGICALFSNEFDAARNEFETAYALNPDDAYLEQLQFCDQRRSETQELEQQIH
jgi:hypothetical protein